MKTTIDINDTLLRQIKRLAARRNTTMRDIFEAALRQLLKERPSPRTAFRLRKCAFHGNGLQKGIEEGGWAEIRRRAYEGRGG